MSTRSTLDSLSREAACALGLALLALAGCTPPPAPPPPSPPRILTFKVDKPQIKVGEAVTLSFEAEGATEAKLLDQFGAEIALSGDASKGQAGAQPARSGFYLLRVRGEGGQDTAFAQVAVSEPLEEIFLVAVPPEIDAGGEAQLIYSIPRAGGAVLTTDDHEPVPTTGETGVVTVKPGRTTRYDLRTPESSGATLLTAAEVRVRPVILELEAAPVAARTGETITFSWKTAGSSEVSLSEATYGELERTTDSARVANGTFEWTVPGHSTADGGTMDLPQGFPLRFSLAAKSTRPALTVTRTLDGYAGEAPSIDSFEVPPAVTVGKPITVSWATSRVVRLQLFVNGLLAYEPLPTQGGTIAEGQWTFPAATANATYELVAHGFKGSTVRAAKQLAVVKEPQISKFTLSQTIPAPGTAATASWTTTDAAEVWIQAKSGPVEFATSHPTDVASGTASLYPAVTTTYVLSAVNAAGDFVTEERTVGLSTPMTLSASPNPAAAGTEVTVSFDITGGYTQASGVPQTTPTVVNNSTAFEDLELEPSARSLAFSDSDEAVARLPSLSGFRFPMLGRVREQLWVSTNGFIAFDDQGPLKDNVDLAASNTAPPMIAPFWDDLELGEGEVLYAVKGTSFPRRLIVQWTNVRLAGDPASSLTFQAQLSEAGDVRFVYGALSDSNGLAQGQSATIGLQVSYEDFHAQHSYSAAGAAEQLEVQFLAAPTSAGSFAFTARGSLVYALAFRNTAGWYVTATVPVYVFGSGDLLVTEVMPVPDPAFALGRWVELYNPQPIEVDLGGLVVRASGSTTGFELLPGTKIAPHGFLVLGESTDPSANGNANVTVVATDLPLGAADMVSVEVAGTSIASFDWTESTAGISAQGPERAIDTAGAPLSCTRTKTFNGNGNIGTPGELNETCFSYMLSPTPAAFEDLSSDGLPITVTSDDEGYGNFQLPAPVTYFGVVHESAGITTNGLLKLGTPISSAYMTNNTKPATTEPNGTVAVFWDDLKRKTTGKLLVARRGNRTIVSWQDFQIYGQNNSSLSFQVKFFDDGKIEYHYGAMTPDPGNSTGQQRASGSSATTWLERLDGTAALPINIDTAGGIQPNTAWRFTPARP